MIDRITRITRILIVLAVPLLILIICGMYVTAQIQTSNTEKRFSTCVNSIPELDSLRYSNGRQLSYDIVGCPVTNVIIHNWNDVNVLDKTSITTTLTAKGYAEKEEITSDGTIVSGIK